METPTLPITITEALAEIKTIKARVDKKRESLRPYLARDGKVKDPFEKEGGSVEWIRRERQAIKDLLTRWLAFRVAIQRKNLSTILTIEGTTRSVQEWLDWRREIAQGEKVFLAGLNQNIQGVREQAKKLGRQFVASTGAATSDEDIIVHLDEAEVHASIDNLERVLGTLDGRLSLLNATTTIDVG